MQNVEFPEVKERMETRVCCAYNVTRNCSISSSVATADLALQPLKALKMLMDGLACDGVSSLWLRSLLGPPLMMHLFPFDFVYLDEDFRILDAVELFPNMPFPKAESKVASAVILPLRTLASTGTEKGDRLVICAHDELDLRLAAIASDEDFAPAPQDLDLIVESVAADSRETLPVDLVPGAVLPILPEFDQPIPLRSSTISPGAGFTMALATTWQIAGATTAAAVLPELEEAVPQEHNLTIVEAPIEEPEPAPEPVDPEAEIGQEGLVEIAAVEEVLPPIEEAPAGQLAEIPETEPDTHPEFVLSTDQLSEAVAAAEAAELLRVAAAQPEAQPADDRIARSKEAWEKATAKTARPNSAGPARSRKKKAIEPKKDPLGTRVIRWLNLEDPLPERRKIIRLLLQGLQAYEVNGDRNKRYEVRDICPTGFCLRMEGKWKRGQLISLMVEKKGSSEKDHEHRVRVQARVMRCDEDGVGLEFVFPKGTEFHPWHRVKTKRSDETEADFILRELRLSHALGFLRRLCPGGAEEIKHALLERLSNKRAASAVDIALMAEDTLIRDGQANLACAHSDMLMRIIEGGSWIEDTWIRKIWSGLMVSSCTADGKDTSNQQFIELLAKLTPLHLRILSFACTKAMEAIAGGCAPKDAYLDCTSEELMEASDSHSFARIQQTVGHLSGYGLFADIARPSYVTLTEKSKTRLAPTAMGLKMWARCNGQRA